MDADALKKKLKMVFALLSVFVVMPIYLYLIHWLLVSSGAGDLQMFLFWIYVPTAILMTVIQKVIEA